MKIDMQGEVRPWQVNGEARAEEKSEAKERPVTIVKNRDIPLLAEVWCIMQEVCRIEQMRSWTRERMHNITQHLTGMPGGGGLPKGLDEAFAMLSDLDAQHEEKCKDYVRQLKEAQKILNGIESRTMRTFVMLKYMMAVPDREIREELNMTRWGFEQARKCVEQARDMESVVWRERYILARD